MLETSDVCITYGLLKRGAAGSQFLGKNQKQIQELHVEFIEALSQTTRGARRHFSKGLDSWTAVIVARYGDKIVGYAGLEPGTNDTLELSALYVEPTSRRKGIAEQLIVQSESVAKKNGSRLFENDCWWLWVSW